MKLGEQQWEQLESSDVSGSVLNCGELVDRLYPVEPSKVACAFNDTLRDGLDMLPVNNKVVVSYRNVAGVPLMYLRG